MERESAETKFKHKLSDFSNPQAPSKEFNANPPRSSTAFTEVFSINDPRLLITSQEGTEREIYNFYKQLYSHVETSGSIENFLHIETQKVTDQENSQLTHQISQTEIENFFKKSNPNKAPGITGLTSAFYKCFWPKIKELVTQAINNVLTNSKKLPHRKKVGIITLIPEGKKDPRHIGNLRPITLLSTFYKIISGNITNTLKPVLDRFIKPWQKAYLWKINW